MKGIINRLEFLLYPICALSGFLFGRLLIDSFSKLTISDFHVYYYVSRAVFLYGTHPYSNFVPIYPYFFPPASLNLFYLLTLTPFYAAKIIWTVLCAGMLLASLYLICKMIFNKITYHFWIMLMLSVIFYPLCFTIRDGQFNLVMLFIYTLGLYALLKGKYLTGGFALGVGVITKISPALVLFYALLLKKIKLVLIAGITIFVLSVISEFTVKKDINYYYIKNVVSKVSNQVGGEGWTDQSFLALFKASNIYLGLNLNPIFIAMGSYFLVAGIVGLFLFLNFRKPTGKYNLYLNYFILTVVGVLGTGLSWYHQYTILLLPLFGAFALCFSFLKKHRTLFLTSFVVTYSLWFLNLKSVAPATGFGQFNMLYGGIVLLTSLFVLRGNPQWFNESPVVIKFCSKYNAPIFLTFLIVGMSPWGLNQKLKEGRDAARYEAISNMGGVLSKSDAKYKVGNENSFSGKNRVGKGYILFEKGEEAKVVDKMSILLIDPVNNSRYNYKSSSYNGINFELKASFESKNYIEKYGDSYSFIW